jgi:Protein of unknown function (DUF3618)
MADRDTALDKRGLDKHGLDKRDTVPARDTARDKGAARPDPDALVAGIEQTRAELARTIDAITDRVSPANVARRTVAQARQRVLGADPRVIGAGALLVAGVTAYLVLRRRRR